MAVVVDRSPAMVRLVYFLHEYARVGPNGRTRPPSEFGGLNWREVYEQFHDRLGDGRSFKTFMGSAEANRGTRLDDQAGKMVLLRGVNLVSWLILESHFSGFAFRDEKSLWAGLERRFGRAKMDEVREAYRSHWITADDIRRVKELGL